MGEAWWCEGLVEGRSGERNQPPSAGGQEEEAVVCCQLVLFLCPNEASSLVFPHAKGLMRQAKRKHHPCSAVHMKKDPGPAKSLAELGLLAPLPLPDHQGHSSPMAGCLPLLPPEICPAHLPGGAQSFPPDGFRGQHATGPGMRGRRTSFIFCVA